MTERPDRDEQEPTLVFGQEADARGDVGEAAYSAVIPCEVCGGSGHDCLPDHPYTPRAPFSALVDTMRAICTHCNQPWTAHWTGQPLPGDLGECPDGSGRQFSAPPMRHEHGHAFPGDNDVDIGAENPTGAEKDSQMDNDRCQKPRCVLAAGHEGRHIPKEGLRGPPPAAQPAGEGPREQRRAKEAQRTRIVDHTVQPRSGEQQGECGRYEAEMRKPWAERSTSPPPKGAPCWHPPQLVGQIGSFGPVFGCKCYWCDEPVNLIPTDRLVALEKVARAVVDTYQSHTDGYGRACLRELAKQADAALRGENDG